MEDALRQIIEGKDACGLKKIAVHVCNKYRNCGGNSATWEDLFYEALTRFIQSIKRGNEPHKQDCRPFFFQICKFICWEWSRQKKVPDDPAPPTSNDDYTRGWMEDLVVLMETVPYLKKAAMECLKAASPKCQVLLQARYFDPAPIHDPQQLADLLATNGYNVNPKNMPQEIANCLGPFRRCLQSKL